MPKKICNEIGCHSLIQISERYCAKHKKNENEYKAKRNKQYNTDIRSKRDKGFYDTYKWKKLRNTMMSRSGGLCKSCEYIGLNTKADVIDHIVPIEIDFSLRFRYDNLQALCHVCHNRKTAEDKVKYGGRV